MMFQNRFFRVGAPTLVAAALALAADCAVAADMSYTVRQNRPIKALSEQDVAALLAGQGAGFAKAAELNGYPGPAHVLELSTPLHLSEAQLRATEALVSEHRARARQLWAQLLAAEAELDELFARKQAAADGVDLATQKIALLQARLRAEHLKTHLAQAALLDPEQMRRYAALRGYGDAENPTPAHPAARHQHHGAGGALP